MIKSCRCVPQAVIDVPVKRRDGGGTWRGIPELHFSCILQLMHNWHSSWEGTGVAGLSAEALQYDFSYIWRNSSWPCLWEQNVPKRPCDLESAATSLQAETTGERTCLPHISIWLSESQLDRPSLRWCLPAFRDTEPCWSAQGLISLKRRQSLGPHKVEGGACDVPAGKGPTSLWQSKHPDGKASELPLLWAHSNTRKNTVVKIWGAMERQKQSLQLKDLPIQCNVTVWSRIQMDRDLKISIL